MYPRKRKFQPVDGDHRGRRHLSPPTKGGMVATKFTNFDRRKANRNATEDAQIHEEVFPGVQALPSNFTVNQHASMYSPKGLGSTNSLAFSTILSRPDFSNSMSRLSLADSANQGYPFPSYGQTESAMGPTGSTALISAHPHAQQAQYPTEMHSNAVTSYVELLASEDWYYMASSTATDEASHIDPRLLIPSPHENTQVEGFAGSTQQIQPQVQPAFGRHQNYTGFVHQQTHSVYSGPDNIGYNPNGSSTGPDASTPLLCPYVGCKTMSKRTRRRKEFSSQKLLTDHIRITHQKSIYCPDCNHSPFGTQSDLKRHHLIVHIAIKETCPHPYCGGRQEKRANLARNDKKAAHDKKYHGSHFCHVLGCKRTEIDGVSYGFDTQKLLNEHIQEKHSGAL